MSSSIVERVLYKHPANLERLRLIFTEYNFEIKDIYDVVSEGGSPVSIASVKLDTDPGNALGLADDDRYKGAEIQYPRIDIERAFRSKLPVLENWVLMDLPDHGRSHVLTDVIRYLRTKNIQLESRFYKLQQLTRDHYMLIPTKDNPRFTGSLTFKSVATVPHEAHPDRAEYQSYDFNMTDRAYLMAWNNYRTYLLCYTEKNAKILTSSNDGDNTKITVTIRIDKNAHILPNIGIPKYEKQHYNTYMNFERMLASDLVKSLGYPDALPLGYAVEVKRVWELIPRLNELYDLGITKSDVVDMQIVSNVTRMRFKTTCLSYAGELLIDIKGNVEPKP